MVKRNGKPLKEYNSIDVRKAFEGIYSTKHKKTYSNKRFTKKKRSGQSEIGYDLKLIKQAINKYGLFQVLSGFYNGVNNNSDNITLKYIIKGFDSKFYLTKHNAEMYYKVMIYGNDKVKASWKKYILLNSKWLPTASSEQKRKELKTRLMEWAHAKTN